MPRANGLNKRRISLRAKRVASPKNIRIVKSVVKSKLVKDGDNIVGFNKEELKEIIPMDSDEKVINTTTENNDEEVVETWTNIFIEILPDYKEELDTNEINNLYTSFMKLGKELYQEHKERNNISKIKFNTFSFDDVLDNKHLLKQNDVQTDELMIKRINELLGNNKYNAKEYNDCFFIKSIDNFPIEKIYKWIKYNYASIECEVPDDEPWQYVNYKRLIDLSIFIYLIKYSVMNSLRKDKGRKVDDVKFQDYIEADDIRDNDIRKYLPLINNIIRMYEMSNMRLLYGYNQLKYKINDDKSIDSLEMVREYDDIFGLIWYMFKLDLVNTFKSYNDEDSHNIHFGICDKCGNPFAGNSDLCEDCGYDNQRRRKSKSRKECLATVDKIKEIVNNHKLPKDLLEEANLYIEMKPYKLDGKVKLVKSLYAKLKNEINKASPK